MEAKLSEFASKTNTDPGLAWDILETHEWDMKNALKAYDVMKGMLVEQEERNHLEQVDTGVTIIRSKGLDITEPKKGFIDSSLSKWSVSPPQHPTTRVLITSSSFKCSSEPSLTPSSSPSSVVSSPSKLGVSKIDVSEPDLLDEVYPKKLSRGISRATDNVTLVSKARTEFAQDFGHHSPSTHVTSSTHQHDHKELAEDMGQEDKCKSKDGHHHHHHPCMDTQEYTFTLPDLSIHSDDFIDFLKKDLIEKCTLVSLENSGRLNWWSDLGICSKLWPLATSGDGNCLLHAASLGMWGFHDRLLTLRKALHTMLSTSSYCDSFYRRWRWQSSQTNKAAGLVLCEEEWGREWTTLLKMASTEPRVRATADDRKGSISLSGGKKAITPEDEIPPHVYESLEELHILALAHVLRRPIVVIADTMLKDVTGAPFAPIPFGGVYLPFECEDECHMSPLCLTYDAAHFSALVAMEREPYADDIIKPPAAIPLTDSNGDLLPLQFGIDPGPGVVWGKDENDPTFIEAKSLSDIEKLDILMQYLDIVKLPNPKKVKSDPEPDTPDGIKVEELKSPSPAPQVKPVTQGEPKKSQTLPGSFHHEGNKRSPTTASAVVLPTQPPLTEEGNRRLFQGLRNRFGSISKSFRKRFSFKKNWTNLAKRGTSFRFRRKTSPTDQGRNLMSNLNGSSSSPSKQMGHQVEGIKKNVHRRDSEFIVCSVLHTEKRHDYHEEMIRNYLSTARIRFLDTQRGKKVTSPPAAPQLQPQTIRSSTPTSTSSTTSSSGSASSSADASPASTPASPVDPKPSSPSPPSSSSFATKCVTTGCSNFGTSSTSYLCPSCYTDQVDEMVKCETEFDANINERKKAKEEMAHKVLPEEDYASFQVTTDTKFTPLTTNSMAHGDSSVGAA